MSGRLQRWRVPLGFVAAAALIVASRPHPWSLALGLPIAALGLGIRAAAAGHIHKNEVLATSGPYRYTRNPLYLGSTVLGFGLVIAASSWLLALLAAAMLLGVYMPVIRQEERFLQARFGEEYTAYAARVPRLWPRLRPVGGSGEGGGFSFALYRRHREYHALLGFLVMAVVLVGKWLAAAPRGLGLW